MPGVVALGLWLACVLAPLVRSQPHGKPITIAVVLVVSLLAGAARARGAIRLSLMAAIPLVAAVAVSFAWQEGYLRRYACHNAASIVDAGEVLMATVTDEMMAESRLDTSGQVSFGVEIAPGDPRVPMLFRSLGAQRLWIDSRRVSVSFGTRGELQISRSKNPEEYEPPMWYRHGKGGRQLRLSTRLWLFDD